MVSSTVPSSYKARFDSPNRSRGGEHSRKEECPSPRAICVLMSVTSISSAPSVRFAVTARAVADGARALGLVVPAFRSPPRLPGASRTIVRRSEGTVVSVAAKGRPFGSVVADLVEGVIAANELVGAEAGVVRDQLWQWAEVHEEVGVVDAA